MRKVHAEEHIRNLFLYSISMFLWRNEMTALVVSVKKMLLQIAFPLTLFPYVNSSGT